MTVGRIVLIPITERIGNQVSIYAWQVVLPILLTPAR